SPGSGDRTRRGSMDLGMTRVATRRGAHRMYAERSWGASVGLTVLGAVVPGSGFWFAGHRKLGAAIVLIASAILTVAVVEGLFNPRLYLHSVLQPSRLTALIITLIGVAVAWVAVILLSHLVLRPRHSTTAQRVIGLAVAIALCLAVAVPLAVG